MKRNSLYTVTAEQLEDEHVFGVVNVSLTRTLLHCLFRLHSPRAVETVEGATRIVCGRCLVNAAREQAGYGKRQSERAT